MDSKSPSAGDTTNYTCNPKGTVLMREEGCCIMKSPITKSDRNGDLITIKALSREPDNTEWTVYIVGTPPLPPAPLTTREVGPSEN